MSQAYCERTSILWASAELLLAIDRFTNLSIIECGPRRGRPDDLLVDLNYSLLILEAIFVDKLARLIFSFSWLDVYVECLLLWVAYGG